MTWTYNLATLSTTPKDQIRYMVGDTDTTDQLIQDEEILFNLVLYPRNTGEPGWLAAAFTCDNIAFSFAREVQNSIGPLSEQSQQKYDHYVALAQQMRVLSYTHGKGLIPGSLAATPTGVPIIGGSGRTYLGTTPYFNPDGM